jgi:hypothetical protein
MLTELGNPQLDDAAPNMSFHQTPEYLITGALTEICRILPAGANWIALRPYVC